MGFRSAILLFASAMSVLPSLASAQDQPTNETEVEDLNAQINEIEPSSVNVVEALAEGFEEVYARADASGLKVPALPVQSDFLRAKVNTAWLLRERSELTRFTDTTPPKLPGIERAGSNLKDWTDYLLVQAEEALQSGNLVAFKTAILDRLFITAASSTKLSSYGPTDDDYAISLGFLLRGLNPELAISELETLGILADDTETKSNVRKRLTEARAGMSSADKQLLLAVGAQYLALKAAGNVLGEDDVDIIEQRIDLLIDAGQKNEAESLIVLKDAINRAAAIKHYNGMVNLRQQNIEIFGFASAAVWDLSGLKAARVFMTPKDPLLLRYSLLVAADAVAAGQGDLADEALEVAKAACAAQACGALDQTAGYKEGAALLKAAKLDAANERLRIGLQTGSAMDPSDDKLMTLKIEMFECRAQAEVEKRGGTQILTRAGELSTARCDSRFGFEILRVRKGRGETAQVDGEYRSVLLETAMASAKLKEWQPTISSLNELYPILRAELDNDVSLSISGSLLAEAQIATKDYSGADATIAQMLADAKQMYAAGILLPHSYRNSLEDVSALQVERLLAEDLRASEAFGPASQLAARQRAFRESLSTQVNDETVLLRALGFSNKFLPVLDAAYAKRRDDPETANVAVAAALLAAQDATLDPTSIAVAMSAAADSAVAGDEELARLVLRRRQLIDELSPHIGVDAEVAFAFDAKAAMLQEQEQAAVELKIKEYEAIDAKLHQQFPEYFDLIRPRALGVEEASALMQPDEATLLVVPTERGTHTFLVSREGVSWHRAELTDVALSKNVKRLLWFAGGNVHPEAQEILDWSSTVDGGKNGFDRATAFALYEALIRPHENALSAKKKVYISALGALGSLPFGLLVTESPLGRDDDLDALQSTKWLADRFVLAQIPSLQSLAFLRRHASPSQGSTFLGVGDPVLARTTSGEATRGLEREISPEDIYGTTAKDETEEAETFDEAAPVSTLANVDLLRQLPELAGTNRELRAMATAFAQGDDTLYLRERARESYLKSADLSKVNILAFATHGLLAGELKPGQSPGLVMTPPSVASIEDDGLLTATEIGRLKLTAEWVILSACNTAAGDGTDGAPALSGLARAFFYAGARSLLVSHWPVLDDMSSTITVSAINGQKTNPTLSRAEAFQQAQREVKSQRRWAHPRSWAPFVFIGDASIANAL